MNNVPIVHYVRGDHPRGCQPAIVTSEFSEDYRPADLTVFMGGSLLYTSYVGYDSAAYVPGTWHRLSDHEPAEQLRKTESSSAQLEELALAVVVNAWNHATELSVLQSKICELVGTARRSAPPNAIPEPEPSTGPLELAARLTAVVTDAWLNAKDRTLPQLHDEALALLTLALRQQ